MIDLDTDDGLRTAMRDVADWARPGLAQVPAAATTDAAVTRLRDQAGPSTLNRWVWAGAAALLVITLIGAIAVRGGQRAEVAASQGAWSTMSPSPLWERFEPATIWTGQELVVWGGYGRGGTAFTDGAAYDPSTDTWRTIADFPYEHWYPRTATLGSAVIPSAGVTAGWTGTEALFAVSNPTEQWAWDLSAYDPAADRWRLVMEARFDQPVPSGALEARQPTAIHTPDGIVQWGDTTIITGWNSAEQALGWATIDPRTGAWGEFNGFAESDDLYLHPLAAGAPYVHDDRLVYLVGRIQLPDPPLGYVADLRTGVVSDIERPVEERRFWELVTSDAGVVAGVFIDTEGQAERVAFRLDTATGRLESTTPLPASDIENLGARLVSFSGGHIAIGGIDQSGTWGGLRSTSVAAAADTDLERWQDLPEAPVRLDRVGHVLMWTGEAVLVWGGSVNDGTGSSNVAGAPSLDGALFTPDRG